MHFAFYFNMNLDSLHSDRAFFLLKNNNPLSFCWKEQGIQTRKYWHETSHNITVQIMKQQEQTRQRHISGENSSDSDSLPCEGERKRVRLWKELKQRDKLVSLCVMGLSHHFKWSPSESPSVLHVGRLVIVLLVALPVQPSVPLVPLAPAGSVMDAISFFILHFVFSGQMRWWYHSKCLTTMHKRKLFMCLTKTTEPLHGHIWQEIIVANLTVMIK